MHDALLAEKHAQASRLVAESDLDVWLTYDRETAASGDPALAFLMDGGLTWHSALLVGAKERIAVVGNYDADPLKASGLWTQVVGYVEGIREPLIAALERLCGPAPKIGVNFSSHDHKADGLSHGMFLDLERVLRGSRFEGCLVSGESVVGALRAVKTEMELQRIRKAIDVTEATFERVAATTSVGQSEREIYDRVQGWIDAAGYGYGWDRAGNPIVNSGDESMIGHGIPSSEIRVEPGHVLHLDLGIVVDGYSSDIQRDWYVPEEGETEVPEDVRAAADAVNAAIDAGAALLKPGALGHQVDAAARKTIVDRGYPEYLHALGHQVGRAAHDGGSVLGPEWDRYGDSIRTEIRENEVYTLELGVTLPRRGYIGIEEMAVVTATGCQFLSKRLKTIPLLSK